MNFDPYNYGTIDDSFMTSVDDNTFYVRKEPLSVAKIRDPIKIDLEHNVTLTYLNNYSNNNNTKEEDELAKNSKEYYYYYNVIVINKHSGEVLLDKKTTAKDQKEAEFKLEVDVLIRKHNLTPRDVEIIVKEICLFERITKETEED